jgi:Domain of unknown function (DUF4291)
MSETEQSIRASFGPDWIRVYQAYSDEIADSALSHQTFVSPPFSMTRMTWIKPSFLWMMYRSGWGKKDAGQKRILAINITHAGFAWALAHSCSSHRDAGQSDEAWRQKLDAHPVRVQWDPERDVNLNPLSYRSIQIGLSGEAVQRYAHEWIRTISDVTAIAHQVHVRLLAGDIEGAQAYLPKELPYVAGMTPQKYVALERERLLATDHEEHEEIVRLLQNNPDNASVSYLRQAIALKPQLQYLDYDDYGAFYKKCLWALQDIGTDDARALITECSRANDVALRDQALYRLKRIAEGGRGANQFPQPMRD